MSTSPGAVLLLLLSVFLLLEYFTGRLDWLFSLGNQVAAGYRAPSSATTAPAPAPGVPSYASTARYRQAYA